LTHLSEKFVKDLLHSYKIHNAEVVIREDVSVDDFIDVVEGNRQYIQALYVYNKVDTITLEEVDRLARQPNSVVISCEWDLNLDLLIQKIWDQLDLVRIYTKKKGCGPDFAQPFIMRSGSTVQDVCERVHKDMAAKFKYALVWGSSAKHCPQRVGMSHLLEDEDVVQVLTLTAKEGAVGVTDKEAKKAEQRAAAKEKKRGKK
jgi:ribosome-interacting GTPase 1